MRILVIGWYGTETIGDRAILAGLISLLGKDGGDLEICLASLYPFHSRLTILDDADLYKNLAAPARLTISCCDVYSRAVVREEVVKADGVIFGGGPLMDIDEMRLMLWICEKAKAVRRPVLMVGVGWGPLRDRNFISVAMKLVCKADLTIFRDEISAREASAVTGRKFKFAIDPSLLACQAVLDKGLLEKTVIEGDYSAINFRVPTSEYGWQDSVEWFAGLVKRQLDECNKIVAVPMHSFAVGGDDRILLNRIKCYLNTDRFVVVNDPPSLLAVMRLYRHADFCVGMRFHSIVLQSYLNGKNVILDYTDPGKGKTIAFCRSFMTAEEMEGRYFSAYGDVPNVRFCSLRKDCYPREGVNVARESYLMALRGVLA